MRGEMRRPPQPGAPGCTLSPPRSLSPARGWYLPSKGFGGGQDGAEEQGSLGGGQADISCSEPKICWGWAALPAWLLCPQAAALGMLQVTRRCKSHQSPCQGWGQTLQQWGSPCLPWDPLPWTGSSMGRLWGSCEQAQWGRGMARMGMGPGHGDSSAVFGPLPCLWSP